MPLADKELEFAPGSRNELLEMPEQAAKAHYADNYEQAEQTKQKEKKP
jgi:hypothetical protein